MPADTFDNVSGQFPIGFFVWDTSIKQRFKKFRADVFDENGNPIGKKSIYANDTVLSINKWIRQFIDNSNGNGNGNGCIGYLPGPAPDFQNNNYLFITTEIGTRHVYYLPITKGNLIPVSIYFAVRKCIVSTWLNDRDQFLYPNDGWKADREFRHDCLAYTIFHGSNNIQSQHGVNHWIPFTESEVNARSKFKSNFMTDFIAGKIEYASNLFTNGKKRKKIVFSAEAKAVFKAGRKLWTYYHSQPKCNVNASLYDIREFFQGRNANGKMNNKSNNETYNALIADLRSALKILVAKIEPKVYEYGFLKK